MNFIQHSLCNDVLGAPRGVPIEECRALPILRAQHEGTPVVQSFWRPDAEELAGLNAGHPIVLSIQGMTHAPLFLGVCITKD